VDLKRRAAGKVVLGVAGLLALFAAWSLGDGGWFLLLAGCAWIIAGECSFHFLTDHSASPYPWLLLSPLLLCHYASVGDFRIRLVCFFMLIYILVLARRRGGAYGKISLNNFKSWQIWLLSFLVFAFTATVFYARAIHLSGDEPHYLMIAQSLVDDHDFDLKNNLENKTYFKYLPVEIPLHGMVHDGRYRSFHLPGVSFLLVPFVYLFNLLGGWIPANLYFRLCAALINAFFALGLFNILKSLWPEKNNSLPFLFFLTTFPLVFQAVHLFPELPASTLLIYAYLLSRRQRKKYLSMGLLLAGIPWLHFKYMVPMLILALSIMAGIWRGGEGRKNKVRNLARFLIPQAVSASLLALYSRMLYGSFNPTIISPEKNFFSIPLLPKIETLLSFFLDQRDGLLVYAPVFLMLFLVFKKEIRGKIRDFPLLAAIFFSYILLHAFTTVRGGYSPAARPTLFVLWTMAVFLTAYYRQAGEAGKTLFRLLAGLTCFATAWIFYYPLFLYQPVTRDVAQRASSLLLFLGSKAVNLAGVFPSFLKKPNAGYLPDWIWLAGLAAGIVLYYARVSWRAATPPLRFLIPLLCLPLLFFLCFIPHVQLQTRYSAAGISFYSNSRNFTFHPEPGAFKVLAGQDYDLFIDLDGSAADRLDMRLLNPGRSALRIKNGRRTLLAESREAENRIQVSLRALKRFSLGKKNLVHLGLESKAGPGSGFFWLEFHR
jgi:hypothetical protein